MKSLSLTLILVVQAYTNTRTGPNLVKSWTITALKGPCSVEAVVEAGVGGAGCGLAV